MLLIRHDGDVRVYKTTVNTYYSPAELYMRISPLSRHETFYGLIGVTEAALELKMIADSDSWSAYFDPYHGHLMVVKAEGVPIVGSEHLLNLTIAVIKTLKLHHQLALTKAISKDFQELSQELEDEIEIEVQEERRREEQEAYKAQATTDLYNIDDILEECYENQLFGD